MKKSKNRGKIGGGIIRNRHLFSSEAEADAVISKRRQRPSSYITITVGGVSITRKLHTPTRKSRNLRREVRRMAGKNGMVSSQALLDDSVIHARMQE